MDTTFLIINISLGTIKVGINQSIYFPYTPNVHSILKMLSPCDCATPVNEASKSRILVKYQPKEIPQHLLQKQVYTYVINKVITVEYTTTDAPEEKKTILLSFNATVTR